MNKFLYQIQKRDLENCIEIHKYFINKTGETYLETIEIPYIIYIKTEDFETLNINDKRVIISSGKFIDKLNQKVTKLEINSKELYEFIIEQIRTNLLKSYEGDLSQEYKYLIENNINISDNPKKLKIIPKIISFDIETILEDSVLKIVSISAVSKCKKINKVYIVSEKEDIKSKDFEIEKFKTESEMLVKFRNDIIEFSPQIIIGCNVVDFDFKVIRDRMQEFQIEFKFSKYSGDTKIRIHEDFFRDSTMSVPGVLIIDGINLLKTNFINCSDYKLDTVAHEILGENKIEVEISGKDKQKALNELYLKNQQKLIDYNYKDSLLVLQIIEKLNLIDLMITRSIITNVPFEKVKSPILSLDLMYLKKLHKKNLVAETVGNYFGESQMTGAYVIEPKSGFLNDIFVFDFKSLYPSIIMTFNIDPFTFSPNGTIKSPNGACFLQELGILPEIIEEIYNMRDEAKFEKDDIKSHALKITMNSFYGAMGAKKSRFYNLDVAEAITSFARFILEKSQKFIENKNYDVVYGDTDSIFVKFNKDFKDLEEKIEFGKVIESEINKYFSDWIKNEFVRKSFLKIEFEKLYSNFFIASKKRYVGFDEFKNKLDFKGLEAVRGDWTVLAKEFQIELIKKSFENKNDKKNIKNFIKEYVKKLNSGEFDKKLEYHKKITKPLEEYTKTTPPHVKAAREVENFSGRLVKYVQTLDGPKHISKVGKFPNFDYKHYQEKQLKGVSDEILEALDIDFDEAVIGEKQNSLDKFF